MKYNIINEFMLLPHFKLVIKQWTIIEFIRYSPVVMLVYLSPTLMRNNDGLFIAYSKFRNMDAKYL